MIYLSDSALLYAINICRAKPKYKVLVATDRRNDWNNIEMFLLHHIRDSDMYQIANTNSECSVQFKNGSSIRCICSHDSFRGYRAHLLIAAPKIDNEIINCVLRPMETAKEIEAWNRLV